MFEMFNINIKLLEPYYGLIIVLLLLSIIFCFVYNIHLSTFIGTAFFILIICYLFNISLTTIIIGYIIPLLELILYLYYLVVSLLYLPFYLIYAIWGAFIRVLSIFGYILKFINDIMMFFYNFVNDIYIT